MPKISGFVIMSEPERLCYPYLESVKSFLPLCDEIIVVYNILFQDEALEKLKNLDPKVKVISGLFDYDRFGWASQGIMRTNGYYASTGDIVLMFDADGILHEKDIEKARKELTDFYNGDRVFGFWMKHRFNQRETWIRQAKHSGFYNKNKLGNSFNFYGGNKLATPNWGILPKEQDRGQQLDIYIYGYERCWDNREIFDYKLAKRRVMQASVGKVLSEEEYIKEFLEERQVKCKNEGQYMPIEEQPKIIQDKLRAITPEQFGYSLFQEGE